MRDHVFGQDQPTANERKTLAVVVITAVTMIVEIVAGLVYGSMALLADGLHMASHAAALGIAVAAYRYARRHAADPRYSFGTGKVGTLAGYTGALMLGAFAVGMAAKSVERLLSPVAIAVDQALAVAVLGLVVNGISVAILGVSEPTTPAEAGEDHGHDPNHPHHDHNFRSAYLHVLADALTSVCAIAALLAAKYGGMTWLDPAMGIVGAVLVASWSIGLVRQSGGVLLDRQAPDAVAEAVRHAVESVPGTVVVDLHVWTVGPGRRAAILALETTSPLEPEGYRSRLPADLGLVHVNVEVNTRRSGNARG
jgi:cation diffusion facilitator family transporter